MGDGHLNECKECVKKRMRKQYTIKSTDEAWLEKERARGREKFKRLGYAGKFKSQRILCPKGSNVSRSLKVRGIDTNGMEAHHWNYNSPKSVFLVSKKAHRRIHLHMTVNRDGKYCYTDDGKRLETPEQAASYFKTILDGYGMTENLNVINI